jgi:radical SAM protein with 4Fe4S-binding SPASM domain
MKNYLKLDEASYIKKQPNGFFLSAVIKGIRTEVGLNNSAVEILKCLTGEYTLSEIILKLSEKFSEEYQKIEKIVREFVRCLDSGGLVKYNENQNFSPIQVRGSEDYYVPELVVLELTHKCPLKCKHCFVNAGVGPSMNKTKLMDILYEFTEHGVQCIQLTGGEPFSYPYIEDVVDFLISKNIRIQITTSGFIFNKKIQRILDKITMRGSLVQISLDGLETEHNEIRGHPAAYQKAITFIEECIQREITVVAATCIINQSIEDIEELMGRLRDLGVSLHRIGGISDQGRAKENNLFPNFSFSKINSLIDYLKEKYETDHFKVGGFEDIDCSREMNCGAGFRIIKVSPLFMVSPCPMMQLNIGNLNNENMENIFRRNSRIFLNLRRPFDDVCKKCKLLEECKNCIAEGFNNKNKVDNCYWYTEQYLINKEATYET